MTGEDAADASSVTEKCSPEREQREEREEREQEEQAEGKPKPCSQTADGPNAPGAAALTVTT